jgi:hypothetical protein
MNVHYDYFSGKPCCMDQSFMYLEFLSSFIAPLASIIEEQPYGRAPFMFRCAMIGLFKRNVCNLHPMRCRLISFSIIDHSSDSSHPFLRKSIAWPIELRSYVRTWCVHTAVSKNLLNIYQESDDDNRSRYFSGRFSVLRVWKSCRVTLFGLLELPLHSLSSAWCFMFRQTPIGGVYSASF